MARCVLLALSVALAAAQTTTTDTTAPKKKRSLADASKSSSSHYNVFRLKYSSAACPSAEEAEKSLLACRNFELTQRLKSAGSDSAKKAISEEKKKMYAAASAKSTDEKKTVAAAHKVLYTKGFSKFCAMNAADEACTNDLMKKLYSGASGSKKRSKK